MSKIEIIVIKIKGKNHFVKIILLKHFIINLIKQLFISVELLITNVK